MIGRPDCRVCELAESEGVGKMQPPKNEFLVYRTIRIFLVSSSIEVAMIEDDDLLTCTKNNLSQRAKYGEGI